MKLGVVGYHQRIEGDKINLALEGKLPRLVEVSDIEAAYRCILLIDGKRSIKEMAESLRSRSSYILITDHSQGLGIAGGLSIGRLMDQWLGIDKLK